MFTKEAVAFPAATGDLPGTGWEHPTAWHLLTAWARDQGQ